MPSSCFHSSWHISASTLLIFPAWFSRLLLMHAYDLLTGSQGRCCLMFLLVDQPLSMLLNPESLWVWPFWDQMPTCAPNHHEKVRGHYDCQWAMAYISLEEQFSLEENYQCQDITIDLPVGQSPYFKHWNTVCYVGFPLDIKFIGKRKVSMFK